MSGPASPRVLPGRSRRASLALCGALVWAALGCGRERSAAPVAAASPPGHVGADGAATTRPSPVHPPSAATAATAATPATAVADEGFGLALPGAATSSDKPTPGVRRVGALTGAVAVGEPLPPFLTTAELSPDRAVRGGLARLARARPTRGLLALLERRADRGCPAVVRALWHTAAHVRSQAAQLVVRLRCRGPALTSALRRGLRKEPDQDVRAVLAKSLITRRAPELVPVLGDVLRRDKSAAVRAQCARALGGQPGSEAVTHLVASLRDGAPKVRAHGANGLGRLRAKGAVDALGLALADPDRQVRKSAARALKLITGRTQRQRPPRRP